MPARRFTTPVPTFVVVQVLSTFWTKQSRGGTAAARRNATPQTLALPPFPPGNESAYLVHTVSFDERTDFEPETDYLLEALPLTAPLGFRALAIHPAEGGIEVRVDRRLESWFGTEAVPPTKRWNPWSAERPRLLRLDTVAPGRVGNRFQLTPGQWGQVLYNRRFTLNATWGYLKWVFNVALSTAPRSDLFTAQPPTVKVEYLKSLR